MSCHVSMVQLCNNFNNSVDHNVFKMFERIVPLSRGYNKIVFSSTNLYFS